MRLAMLWMPVAGLAFLALLLLHLFNRNSRPSPYQGSKVSFTALIINWLFYLFGVYVLLPVQVADVLFTLVWVVLLLSGAFWAVKEWRSNRLFALLLGALTFFTSLFVLLIHGISKM